MFHSYRLVRYHRFLDLVSRDTSVLHCSTLDIDLIWHAHQLKIESYRDDTSRLLTNFLNHPDKVDEASLEEAFIGKAEAWKSQYDELYSTAVLEAPRSTYFWSRENPSTPSEPAKPVDEEYRDATQASTHNSVWLVANKACLTNRESREHNRIQQTKVAEKAWAKKSVSKLPSNRTSENYDPDLFYHQTSHSLGQWGCTKVGVPHHPLAGWGMGSECYPHDFHWKEMQRAPCLCGRSKCCLGEGCEGSTATSRNDRFALDLVSGGMVGF